MIVIYDFHWYQLAPHVQIVKLPINFVPHVIFASSFFILLFIFSTSLRNQLEQTKHESSLQMTQCKLEAVRSQGLIERERDSLNSQVDGRLCYVIFLLYWTGVKDFSLRSQVFVFMVRIFSKESSHEKLYEWLSSNSWYPRNRAKSFLLTSCPQSSQSMQISWKKYSICSLSSSWWKHSPFWCFHWIIHYWRLSFFLNFHWTLLSSRSSYSMIICFISIKWNTTGKRII